MKRTAPRVPSNVKREGGGTDRPLTKTERSSHVSEHEELAKAPEEPTCFEEWLTHRTDRDDETGRVARWVLDKAETGGWTPTPVLFARHGHTYDDLAHMERYLRYDADLSDEQVAIFMKVYERYLEDALAGYDQMVEERSQELGDEFGGGGSGNGGGGNAATGGGGPGGPDGLENWLSWSRFFYELKGRENLGYDIDEDGWPVEPDPRSDVEWRPWMDG